MNTFDRDGAVRSAVAGLSSAIDENKVGLVSGLLDAKIEEPRTFEEMPSAWDERQENEVVNETDRKTDRRHKQSDGPFLSFHAR